MEPVNRPEFDATVERLDAENSRQNHRLEKLEDMSKQITDLTTSVGKIALSVESMTKELSNQGKRLSEIESRDGERWRELVKYVLTAVIGVVIGVVVTAVGL